MQFKFKHSFSLFGVFLSLSFGMAGCRHEKPNFIYMPDMVYSPAIKAQKEGSMRMPVQGTVPRDFVPYPYKNEPDVAGRELKNPLKPTREVLEQGQKVYNVTCRTCHGTLGLGDGTVVPRYPRPPSLQSDKVRNWSDGSIYHVITMGQNIMPSYASQIAPADRWKIIHYVRVLQRSQHPTAEDLKILNQESK